MKTRKSAHLDYIAAAVLLGVYFLASSLFLNREDADVALLAGTVVFPVVLLFPWKLGPKVKSSLSIFAVSVLAMIVLSMPTWGSAWPAIAIGFLGVHAAAFLWSAFWWRRPLEHSAHVSIAESLRFGLFAALAFSAIAAVTVSIGLISKQGTPRMLLVFPGYFAGFLIAALIYWALQRLQHLALGRYLVGALGGACVMLAIMPAVSGFNREALDIPRDLLMAIVAGSFVGPPIAFTSAKRARQSLADPGDAKLEELAT